MGSCCGFFFCKFGESFGDTDGEILVFVCNFGFIKLSASKRSNKLGTGRSLNNSLWNGLLKKSSTSGCINGSGNIRLPIILKKLVLF